MGASCSVMMYKQVASEDVCDLRSAFADRDRPLASADVEMKNLNEAKSDFIAVAAHELRSPLIVIAGYLDLLLDGADDSLTNRQLAYHTQPKGACHVEGIQRIRLARQCA